MNFDDEEQLKERFARKAQDFTDLQNELAGRGVGRISRFIGESSETRKDRGKRRADSNAELTALQIMMNDEQYARLYRKTETKLHDAQNRLETQLEIIQDERERLETHLESDLTAEQRRKAEARLEALRKLEEDIRLGQAEIGDMQERIEDEENPPSEDELESIQRRADEIASGIEDRVSKITASSEQNLDAKSNAPVVGAAIPEL
ncbi:MAG: hypothetical protein AAF636_18750 [Pseudomonadota bacterium]